MMIHTLAAPGLLLVLMTCAAAQSNLVARDTDSHCGDAHVGEGDRPRIPQNALQIARILGVQCDIERLSSLQAAKGSSAAPGSLEELSLRQKITNEIIAASFDVDSVAAEIDYEREQTMELRNSWHYKRDRAIGSTNLAVLAAGTGLGIVSGVLQFSKTTSAAGNAVGFAAGGVSTLFSLRGFRQVRGGRRPAWVLPNMLAGFLSQPEEQHSHYPEDVWAYLNDVPAGATSKTSRKEQLISGWVAAGRIGSPDSPQLRRRIALLTSTDAADKNLDIEVMNERTAMLADVADQVLLMKRDLADLLRGLRRK